jgi:hypothetical protein
MSNPTVLLDARSGHSTVTLMSYILHVGPGDFDLIGLLKNYLPGKQFAAGVGTKVAVCIQVTDTGH